MIARTGAPGRAQESARVVHLANHRLVFQQVDPAGPVLANIQTPGEGVLGVVYRCTPADLERLDHYQAGYQRKLITVTDQHGKVLVAVAYVMRPAGKDSNGQPQPDYLERIVTGARQHGLPDEYIAGLVRNGSPELSLAELN
jgi:cation transport regulator ChaC